MGFVSGSNEKAPKVSIVIVNWNGWKETIECLESSYHINYPDYDIVVVDNGSNDKSIEMINAYVQGKAAAKANFLASGVAAKPIQSINYSLQQAELGGDPELERLMATFPPNRRLRIISIDKPDSYAAANNLGMKYAIKALDPDYILLLNNDTVVEESFLTELVTVGESDEVVAMVGPKTYFYDFEGRHDVIYFTGGGVIMRRGWPIFYNAFEIDAGQYDRTRSVDVLSGACMLVKREMIDLMGLLSTDYFLYWEDTDWCFKARQLGFKLIYVPRANIWHKVSASAKSLGLAVLYYKVRGRFYFMKRFASKEQLVLFLSRFFFYEFWLTTGNYLRLGKIGEFRMFCKAIFDGLLTHGHEG